MHLTMENSVLNPDLPLHVASRRPSNGFKFLQCSYQSNPQPAVLVLKLNSAEPDERALHVADHELRAADIAFV